MEKRAVSKLIWIVLGILIVGAVIAYFSLSNKGPDTSSLSAKQSQNVIVISNSAFSPAELTIRAGDIVTWVNQGTASHTVTSDKLGELNSILIKAGQSFSHQFNVTGEFAYHCEVHPLLMRGNITVR